MARALFVSPRALARLGHADTWLAAAPPSRELLILGATLPAARELARARPSFGWHRFSLAGLASTLAAATMAERGVVPAGSLALEALAARVVHVAQREGRLGRLSPVGDRPGLPRALARTFAELRLAGVAGNPALDPDLARLFAAYGAELAEAKLADRALVYEAATAVAKAGTHALRGLPLLFLDVAVTTNAERSLLEALLLHTTDALATLPRGDARSEEAFRSLFGVQAEHDDGTERHALGRLQRGLFSEEVAAGTRLDERVSLLSAPGENRECVEIARRIHREASGGVAFDRMAILLRSPGQYRAHVEEALGRAGIPSFFARGARRPDPSGRSFLALLACAADDLSASRFAEYMSLGELPPATPTGGPPEASPPGERWVSPDEEMLPLALRDATEETEPAPPVDDALLVRTPRRWERMLLDAAVIGGRDRWARRLAGLRAERRLDLDDLEDPDGPDGERIRRELVTLDALEAFALPILDALAALPTSASWGEWLDALSSLATRTLRQPDSVLAVLGELSPMGAVGPVTLREVRLVLAPRLTELTSRPVAGRYGRVFVGTPDEARGLSFDVVFVPGLAEKLFPQRVAEDPILRDEARVALGSGLVINAERVAGERLALHLVVGAASERLVLSYPRLDVDQARPRTPSFYALEVLRAAEGRLPGFDELAMRAESATSTRLGWPAPSSPEDAIDDAEHDLSLLARVFALPAEKTVGTARYLLSANPHLARSLRARGRRWRKGWFPADGLVDPSDEARAAMVAHQLSTRSFSPTALQHFAACPYRFFLSAIHRLSPRREPSPIEEMDPLQKGSLLHEVQFDLHVDLRDRGLLPITHENLDEVRSRVTSVLFRVADRFRDELAPAIPRVWDDGIQAIESDLREWLRRAALEKEWIPEHFELSFGLTDRRAQDRASHTEPAVLECGIRLRGSIDLVEKREGGVLRATDYKTGKARAKEDASIGGGEILQPVLYALALEALLPSPNVLGGRLYYCTSNGEFRSVFIPLSTYTRDDAKLVASAVGGALADGFLPAYPKKGACEYCDYLPVCGPHEEARTSRKSPDRRLEKLIMLRSRP